VKSSEGGALCDNTNSMFSIAERLNGQIYRTQLSMISKSWSSAGRLVSQQIIFARVERWNQQVLYSTESSGLLDLVHHPISQATLRETSRRQTFHWLRYRVSGSTICPSPGDQIKIQNLSVSLGQYPMGLVRVG
jgi:hypothetical protein